MFRRSSVSPDPSAISPKSLGQRLLLCQLSHQSYGLKLNTVPQENSFPMLLQVLPPPLEVVP